MSKDNLVLLSLKLLATPLVEDHQVLVLHDQYRKQTVCLSEGLREAVHQLVEEIRAVIPNDYTFCFCFDLDGVYLRVEFEDGNTGSTAGAWSFTSRKSMIRKIRGINWDAKRAELIQQGGIFEQLTSEAEDRPVDIPSSEEAAQLHAAELQSIFDGIKREPNKSPFVLVTARADEGVETINHNSRKDVVYEVADAMTTGYDILAIVEQGVPWAFETVETAKLEAVEQLGPISRAKAERRF